MRRKRCSHAAPPACRLMPSAATERRGFYRIAVAGRAALGGFLCRRAGRVFVGRARHPVAGDGAIASLGRVEGATQAANQVAGAPFARRVSRLALFLFPGQFTLRQGLSPSSLRSQMPLPLRSVHLPHVPGGCGLAAAPDAPGAAGMPKAGRAAQVAAKANKTELPRNARRVTPF